MAFYLFSSQNEQKLNPWVIIKATSALFEKILSGVAHVRKNI
jgi:hypothetical protein